MQQLGTEFTEQELALVRRHAELVGRTFDDHVRRLLIGSAKAFIEADSVGALPAWTGRHQHARNTHVDPGADK